MTFQPWLDAYYCPLHSKKIESRPGNNLMDFCVLEKVQLTNAFLVVIDTVPKRALQHVTDDGQWGTVGTLSGTNLNTIFSWNL